MKFYKSFDYSGRHLAETRGAHGASLLRGFVQTAFFIPLLIGCSNFQDLGVAPKNKNNNVALQALSYAVGKNIPNVGPLSICGASAITPIANAAVTSPYSTQYNLLNCSPSLISGFTSKNITTSTRGLSGTSSSSTIISDGAQVGSGGVSGKSNIEVSFFIGTSSGSLDIISYGDGASFSGPAWRITAAQNQYKDQNGTSSSSQIAYKSQDGVFRVPVSGSTPAVPTNPIKTVSSGTTARTVCLDFHASAGTLQAAWDGTCSSVSETKKTKAAFPISIDPADIAVSTSAPLTPVGQRIGFILNNVTITNFTVSSQLRTVCTF